MNLRRLARIVGAVALLLLAAPLDGLAQDERDRPPGKRVSPKSSRADAPRIDERFDARTGSQKRAERPEQRRRAQARLRDELGPFGILEIDPLTATPAVVGRRLGFLTAASGGSARSIALGYVADHADAFGLDADDRASLELADSYRSESGAFHLWWRQVFQGIELYDNFLGANVDADGRLINILGSPVPDPQVDSIDPGLSAEQALGRAAADVGRSVDPRVSHRSDGPERRTRFEGDHRARLVLFHAAGGERLAWEVLFIEDPQHVWESVLDARTGEVLIRNNRVRHSDGRAFENYPGAPSGGTSAVKTFSTTGNDPWLTGSLTVLRGNNVHTYADPADDTYIVCGSGGCMFKSKSGPASTEEVGPSAGSSWDYPRQTVVPAGAGPTCPSAGCSWDGWFTPNSWQVNIQQSATQAFWFANAFHDHLRDAQGIAFDEASGNFEATNSSGQGAGGDEVKVQVMNGANTGKGPNKGFPDAAHVNNADFITLADGTAPQMQLYLFTSWYFRDGSHEVAAWDDASTVYHEYTHGLSTRLVGGPSNYQSLDADQSAAMGEGWSDWYAHDRLLEQGHEQDTNTAGEIVDGEFFYLSGGFRTQPIDCTVGAAAVQCPGAGDAGSGGYTFGDMGEITPSNPSEVHANGEIWVETLMDLRRELVGKHGATEGTFRVRALVTDGMRLSPTNPDFLDMRDAILQAETNRGFDDEQLVWDVFAGRGMGENASTTGPSDMEPTEDFTSPDLTPDASGPDFNGDGFADLAVGAPGEDGSGSATDIGVVNVLYGSASGLASGGATQFTQSQAGGSSQAGDRFGTAVGVGDFDQDGFADLAVGAPDEDISGADAGVVNVLYGSASGLASAGAQQFTQSQAGGSSQAGDRFGTAVGVGDFDQDGFADLAAGAPDEDGSGSATDIGVVNVLYGSASGLASAGAQQFTQTQAGGTDLGAGDRFGTAVGVGDFDQDGFADLAAGAPDEDGSGSATDIGVVNVLYGSASGLASAGAQQFTQTQAGGTDLGAGDRFGTAVGVGDFDQDGFADLAAGAPDEDGSGSATDIGVVNVLYGSASGLASAGAQQFTQTQAGGTDLGAGDRFGTAVGVGDFDQDGFADLAAGAPDEDGSGSATDIGVVNVLYGSASGLASAGAQQFTQTQAGGTDLGAGDRFGTAVGVGDFDQDGFADLAAGAPDEDGSGSATDIGVVNVLYGSASGLASAGAQQFTQTQAGGTDLGAGDRFGAAIE